MDDPIENIEIIGKNKTNGILISIVIITYNSAKYVLETLESSKKQTYKNIELILSDDCSTDNTVEISRTWIEKNRGRFSSVELITSEKNTGIPANCNRGVKAAKGDWIKLIAGDDILEHKFIEYFFDYLVIHPHISVISFSVQFFENIFREENFGIVIKPEEYTFFYPGISAEQQYNILLRRDFVWGSGLMIKKEAVLNVGGYDEKFRWIEDWPLLLKLTKAGYKIHALNKLAVYYRRHDAAVLSDPRTKIFSDFYRKARPFHVDYIHPNITVAERIADNLEYLRRRAFDLLGLNKPNYFCKWLFSVTTRFNPARIILDYALKKSLKVF
jgi:GT2 family glycosyltransferase